MPRGSYTAQHITTLDDEREVEVTYKYYPGDPGRMHGDYPYPAEPESIEILEVFEYTDGILGDEVFLNDDEEERIKTEILEDEYVEDEY